MAWSQDRGTDHRLVDEPRHSCLGGPIYLETSEPNTKNHRIAWNGQCLHTPCACNSIRKQFSLTAENCTEHLESVLARDVVQDPKYTAISVAISPRTPTSRENLDGL